MRALMQRKTVVRQRPTEDLNAQVLRLSRQNAVLRREVARLQVFRSMAYRDPLTGLWNRRYLEERLAEEESRSQLIIANTGRDIPLGLSLGTATWPDDGGTITELVAHADEEMYADKRRQKALAAAAATGRARTAKAAARDKGKDTTPFPETRV